MTIAHRWIRPGAQRAFAALAALAASAVLAIAACGDGAVRRADSASAQPGAAAPVAATARGDGSCPLTGVWRECSVLDRLEKSGMAPRRLDGTVERPGFSEHGFRYALGDATLEVFLYDSEAERRSFVGALDSATASPPGRPTDWPKPPTLVQSGNLAAVFYGGRAREAERVALALTAGLPER